MGRKALHQIADSQFPIRLQSVVAPALKFDHLFTHGIYMVDAKTRIHCFFIKDLSRLGRDISKTLIVDNVAENFQLQPDNGVFIRTWIDDPTDNALDELAPLLKEIAVRNVKDVREALRVFRI